ncbi:hypothetical protein MSG28_004036 [Choristoneura fumiferana]|uniref:Uncharacterized protein n=1 Tax=Choristoneura fumiferana TaxID=7141 RepID=A0ACC0KH39_CHOFU|nr:hypothetical protein MSG28_004036 [Choristoneura fumiferana]
MDILSSTLGNPANFNPTTTIDSVVSSLQLLATVASFVNVSWPENSPVKGSKLDFDEWAAAGHTNWNWESVLKYLKKAENMLDKKLVNGPTSEYHCDKGPFSVKPQSNNELFVEKNRRLLKGYSELGMNILEDPFVPIPNGTGELYFNIKGDKKQSRRASSAEEYLLPIKDNGNFHILKEAQVIKILINDNKEAIGSNVISALDTVVSLTELSSFPTPIVSGVFSSSTGTLDLQHITLLFVALTKPESRGRVTLRSTNPFDPPKIFNNFFAAEEDLERMIGAVKKIKNLESTPEYSDVDGTFIRPPLPECDDLEYQSEDYWACYVKSMATTIFHPASTCAMGLVVDNNLKVKGIKKLSVADDSIMPFIPRGTTAMVSIMIAEKAADIIKKEHGKTEGFEDFPSSNNSVKKDIIWEIDVLNKLIDSFTPPIKLGNQTLGQVHILLIILWVIF